MSGFKLKAIEFYHSEDFGHEYSLKFIKFKDFSLLKIIVGFSVCDCSWYASASLGMGRLLDIFVSLNKLSIEVEILGRNW